MNCGQWSRLSDRDLGKEAKLYSTESVLFHYYSGTVYRSEDFGKTWKDLSAQFPRGEQCISETSSGLISLTTGTESGNILVLKSVDIGNTWRTASAFSIEPSTKITDIVKEGNRLVAVSDGRSFYISDDQGITWKETKLPRSIGTLADVALSNEIWIACGTESVLWSSDAGKQWNMSPAPAETGNLVNVETNLGRIWAGGLRGTCWFDVQSRSWVVESQGLAQYAQITSAPVSLVSYGNVLFGVFSTLDGAQMVYSRHGWQDRWELVKVFGLPTHNAVRRHSISVMNNMIFVYHRGDDATTPGVYGTYHQVLVSVWSNNNENSSTFSVWPNPATNVLHVQAQGSHGGVLSLTDTEGRTWVDVVGSALDVLQINHLPNGVYFVTRMVSGVSSTRRIVVQR